MGIKKMSATCISVLVSSNLVYYTFKRKGFNSYVLLIDDNPNGDLLIKDIDYTLATDAGLITYDKETIAQVVGKYILFNNGEKLLHSKKCESVEIDYTESLSPENPIKELKAVKLL